MDLPLHPDIGLLAQRRRGLLRQLTKLERIDIDSVDPEWISEVTDEAMTSSALEAIRDEAGRFAYMAEGAMRFGPTPSS